MNDRSNLTRAKSRFPDLKLISAAGAQESLLQHGRSLVLMLVHDAACTGCRAYLADLGKESEELRAWDANVAIVSADADADALRALPVSSFFKKFIDPERRVANAAGVSPPAVLVIDQWADIKDARAPGEGHELAAPEEVVSWARYLAMQCPECEGESL